MAFCPQWRPRCSGRTGSSRLLGAGRGVLLNAQRQQGDATDPFDGVRFRRFAWDTNPAFSGHTGFARNLPLGVAIDNIRPQGAAMVVDVVRQQRPGHIVGDATWTGRVGFGRRRGRVTGATLTIDAGAEIRFARGDAQGTGFDPDRSELIVYAISKSARAHRLRRVRRALAPWIGRVFTCSTAKQLTSVHRH